MQIKRLENQEKKFGYNYSIKLLAIAEDKSSICSFISPEFCFPFSFIIQNSYFLQIVSNSANYKILMLTNIIYQRGLFLESLNKKSKSMTKSLIYQYNTLTTDTVCSRVTVFTRTHVWTNTCSLVPTAAIIAAYSCNNNV